jgi:hypothetical protein
MAPPVLRRARPVPLAPQPPVPRVVLLARLAGRRAEQLVRRAVPRVRRAVPRVVRPVVRPALLRERQVPRPAGPVRRPEVRLLPQAALPLEHRTQASAPVSGAGSVPASASPRD